MNRSPLLRLHRIALRQLPAYLLIVIAAFLSSDPGATSAAAELSQSASPASNGAAAGIWDLVIAIIVCSVAGSVAYLCYCAVRLWNGIWRGLVVAPLLILAIWMGILFFAMLSGATRSLWTVEILSWAMATTVYLVVLFTARRTFEKAEAEHNRNNRS